MIDLAQFQAKPLRVLVLKLDGLGDLVLASPFLRELRRTIPRAEITLVVGARSADLAQRCPHVSRVLVYQGSTLRTRSARHADAWHWGAEHLAILRPDVALIPRAGADHCGAARMAHASGARCRVGLASGLPRDAAGEGGPWLTEVVEDGTSSHEVERTLHFLRELGGEVRSRKVEAWHHPEDCFRAFRKLRLGSRRQCLVGLGVGASAPNRRWPPARFRELVRRTRSELKCRFVLVGSGSERPIGTSIAKGLRDLVIDATGRVSVPELSALMSRLQLYVGSDSGPMHLAWTNRVPTVVISPHSTHATIQEASVPERFGPRGVDSRWLQPAVSRSPCVRVCSAREPHCIRDVSVVRVASAMGALLREAAS